jgi:hypothetical protein
MPGHYKIGGDLQEPGVGGQLSIAVVIAGLRYGSVAEPRSETENRDDDDDLMVNLRARSWRRMKRILLEHLSLPAEGSNRHHLSRRRKASATGYGLRRICPNTLAKWDALAEISVCSPESDICVLSVEQMRKPRLGYRSSKKRLKRMVDRGHARATWRASRATLLKKPISARRICP